MRFFDYDAAVLPQITLLGKTAPDVPHRNIRRVSTDWIFYVVTEGEMVFEEGGQEYTLKKGDAFLFEPGLLHFGTQDTYHHFFYVHFRHPDIREVPADTDTGTGRIAVPKLLHLDGEAPLAAVSALFDKAITASVSGQANADTQIACITDEMLITLYRQYRGATGETAKHSPAACARVNEVLRFLHTHYQQKITGDSIQKSLSYNFDYLNQLFRQQLHTSVFQMLETIRMENAERLLLTSSLSVNEIAREVGYTNEPYFFRVFKKHTGFTPAAYRGAAGAQ